MVENDLFTTIQLSHLLAVDMGLNGDESIVIDIIWQSASPITNGGIGSAIEKTFHVRIEKERLASAIERLIDAKKVFYSEDALVLAPSTIEEINKTLRENENVEKEALDTWVLEFEKIIEERCSANDQLNIRNAILSFIREFFLAHGADCYSFVFGQKQNSFIDIDTVAAKHAKLDDDKKIPAFTAFLVSIFTLELTPAQRAFLFTQLKKAISYLSMVIDRRTRLTIMHQLEGVTIYLDTSILYRLLNLQGEKRYESISRLVQYCREANIAIKIFGVSIEEMKRRIDYDARVIIEHPIPVNFASIGYRCRSSENYISTFWKAASETGVTPKDFNAKYSDIEGLLTSLGIILDTNNYVEEYELEQVVSDVEGKIARFERPDFEYQKSPKALNHDAQCLAIIEKLQKPHAKTAIEGEILFLSSDRTLMKVQRYDYEYKNKADIVVMPSQLLQLFGMTSPTQDYLETFLGLFSSSRMYFGSNTLPNEKIQEIIGRVAMFRGTTPAYAERVLTCQLIQASFEQKETEEDKTSLIDDAMIIEVEAMELEIGEKGKALELAQTESKNKKATIDTLEERIKALEKAQAGTYRALSESRDEIVKASEKADRHEKRLRQIAESRGKRKARLKFSAFLLILISGIIISVINLAAIVPNTYRFVAPVFEWIHSSSGLVNDTNGFIITIGLTIGFAAIGCGFYFIKPGISETERSYVEKEMNKLVR